MSKKPLVSIITPSYNCAKYIEETILNIFNQDYPNIEHIVIDGGSQDDTLKILNRHSDKLTWISEPDKGMYDAINKGFKIAKGDIFTYINADDLYYSKNTVSAVVDELLENKAIDFTYGNCMFVNDIGRSLYTHKAPHFNRKLALGLPKNIFQQPTCFWRKRVYIGFDSGMNYCADAKFFRHLCKNHKGRRINQTIAKFRVRVDSISFLNREKLRKEDESVYGVRAERKIRLRFIILDLVYLKTILNLKAYIKKFILHCKKQPYL